MAKVCFNLLVLLLALGGVSVESTRLDRQCLDCICLASTGCNTKIGCHNGEPNQYFCGPYQISWAYWADGGKPGNINDFESCLVDKQCSEAAIGGYMSKATNQIDCNGDGRIDCLDYAAIHKAGAGGCNQKWLLTSKYWTEFNKCFRPSSSSESFVSANNNHDENSGSITSMIEIPKNQLPSFIRSSVEIKPVLSPGGIDSSLNLPFPIEVASASASADAGSDSVGAFSSAFASSSSSHSGTSENLFSSFENEPTNTFRIQNVPSVPLLKPILSPSRVEPAEASVLKPKPFEIVVNEKPEIRTETSIQSIVKEDCLQCLCFASSKCDLNKGCDGPYCGPYLLSWGYWSDGGKHEQDYATCSKTKLCSEKTIQGYMAKWQKDCNEDGKIDCTDFALIHKLGPHGCNKLPAMEPTQYWTQFKQCESRNQPTIALENLEPSSSNNVISNENLIIPERFVPALKPTKPAKIDSLIEVIPESSTVPLSRSRHELDSESSYRITFNNRDIVNTFPNRSSLPDIPKPIISRRRVLKPPTISRRIITIERDSPEVEVWVGSRRPPAVTVNRNPSSEEYISNRRPVEQPSIKPIEIFNSQPRSPARVQIENNPLRNDIFIKPPRPGAPLSNSFDERPSNNEPNVIRSIPQNFNSNSRPGASDSSVVPKPIITRNQPIVDDSDSSARPKPPPTLNSIEPKPFKNLTNQFVPKECLECICHASSRCRASIGCRNDGSGKHICGPYQIDFEYWTEAGKPGQRADLTTLENFQVCLTTRTCADQTVQSYMTKFQKDCNEDGSIDCNDFAAIHVAGPRSCNADWYRDSKYYADFRECFDF